MVVEAVMDDEVVSVPVIVRVYVPVAFEVVDDEDEDPDPHPTNWQANNAVKTKAAYAFGLRRRQITSTPRKILESSRTSELLACESGRLFLCPLELRLSKLRRKLAFLIAALAHPEALV